MKKIIPALALLLVSAVLLSTASFAWFSMNNTVTVTGMEIKTKVNNNLLIDAYAGSWATNDSTFASSLTQTIDTNNTVVPLSTIDGINFFYTDPDNVAGDGHATAADYTAYTTLADLQTKYGDAEAPYLDYHFILKADNTSASSQYINLTKCDLIYNGAKDTNKAFRVAVFAKKFTTAVVDGAKTAPGMPAAATTILVPGTAANYFTSGKAVNAIDSVDSVLTLNTAANLATVAANQTEYYEVVVRLWLEGEDKTCNVEVFKGLTSGDWNLDLEIKLESSSAGVTSLRKFTSTVVGTATYYCDGTSAYTEIDGDALTSAACTAIDGGLEAALESAFGITIS